MRKVLQNTGPGRQRVHHSPSKHTLDRLVCRIGAIASNI